MGERKSEARVILAEDLIGISDGESFPVPPGLIISALAREEAARRGIRLVEKIRAIERQF